MTFNYPLKQRRLIVQVEKSHVAFLHLAFPCRSRQQAASHCMKAYSLHAIQNATLNFSACAYVSASVIACVDTCRGERIRLGGCTRDAWTGRSAKSKYFSHLFDWISVSHLRRYFRATALFEFLDVNLAFSTPLIFCINSSYTDFHFLDVI